MTISNYSPFFSQVIRNTKILKIFQIKSSPANVQWHSKSFNVYVTSNNNPALESFPFIPAEFSAPFPPHKNLHIPPLALTDTIILLSVLAHPHFPLGRRHTGKSRWLSQSTSINYSSEHLTINPKSLISLALIVRAPPCYLQYHSSWWRLTTTTRTRLTE